MNRAHALALVVAGLSLGGCSGAAPAAPIGDAAVDSSVDTAEPPTDTVPQTDSQPPPTDGPPSDVGSPDAGPCEVNTTAALQRNYYCDTAAIHVLTRDSGAAEVRVTARVGSSGMAGCGVIDSVEIVRGATLLQRLDATRRFTPGSTSTLAGLGPASAPLLAACEDTTTRLSAYGLILRGADARGPFEARCGTAESGSRWPPGTHLACHRNLELPPLVAAASSFMVMGLGGSSSTSGYLSLPHGPGRPALTSVEATLEVLSPQRAAFAPGAPLTGSVTRGWSASVSESTVGETAYTQVSLNAFGMASPFPSELCPVPGDPGPGYVPPPFFLARLTGRGASGPVTVEVLSSCTSLGR